jgi:succinate dehydrogenase / fumarate reductase, cytochrome b subunit
MPNRPLSPHLQVYKPQITSLLSITHRLTGLALTVAAVFVVLWLWALAFSPDLFKDLAALKASIIGQVGVVGFTLAACYHLCNGMRHLLWDIGKGFGLRDVTKTGYMVLIAAVALAALVLKDLL